MLQKQGLARLAEVKPTRIAIRFEISCLTYGNQLKSLAHETLMRSTIIGALYFVFEDSWFSPHQNSIAPSTTIRMEEGAAFLIHQVRPEMLLFMNTVSALSLSPSRLVQVQQ